MLELCLVIMLMIQKLLRMSTFFFSNTSIIEDALVDFGTLIIDENNVSSDNTSDNVAKIIESDIHAKPNKLFEFPCADYGVCSCSY